MSRPTTSVKTATSRSQILHRLNAAVSTKSKDAALKSVVQLLREGSDHFDWVGIYLVEGDSLFLAAYSGEAETEHVRIPIGQGICGLAAEEGTTVIVPDVSKDPRYLMCFPSTRSEIVVPITSGEKVLGEIDIDSDRLSAFSPEDQEILEHVAATLASYLEKQDSASKVSIDW